jgi:hypothetical protein
MRGDLEVCYTNTDSSAPDRIEFFDRSSGKGLGDRRVSLNRVHRWAISLFTLGLLFICCCLLNIAARRDLSDRRLWTDAAILSCVVLLLGINLPSIAGMGNSGAHPHIKTATVLIGTAISLLFILPLATKRPFHR